MTKLQFIEGPNAKMHLTMVISSSSYPKFIYGMPLFAKMAKLRFEFEFKFKFELNQKRKRKRKKGEGTATWAGLGQTGPSHLSTAHLKRSHAAEREKQRKKKKGRAHGGPGPSHLLLHGPGAQRPAPTSEPRDSCD